jgi:hypothetical protein
MPRAGDAFLSGALPVTHSPLDRVDFQALAGKFDLEAFVEQVTTFVEDYLFPIIEDLTGLDLSILQPLIDDLKTFMDGITAALSGDPLAFFTALETIFTSSPTDFFGDLLGLFGNPTGLGTGSPSIGSLGSIPILGPIFGLFGASNATQAGNVFTNLFGLLSNPALTTTPGSFNPSTALFTGAVTEIRSLINSLTGGTTNPLSSLISSLLGTASTASTANTNASTGLSNWSTLLAGLPGISTISGLLGFLQPTTGTSGIFAPLINGITGGTTNPLSSLLSSLTGTASTASTASTNASTGLAGISTFLLNMFNGINRTTATAATQDDTYGAVASQADTVVGTAATMEQIIAALGSGSPDADDFERASLGSAWTVYSTGSGSLTIPNAHDAKWSGTGSSSEFVAYKNDKVAAGDHQTSTLVLATAIPSYPFFTPLPYGGYADLWVRMTAFASYATRTGLRFRINGNPPYNATWSLDWISSGTATNLGSGSMSIPGAGASLALEAGVDGNNRRFQARLNGTIITGADITEAGTTSQFGATYRSRGFGGKGNSGIGTAQGVPSFKQWTAQG